MGKNGSIDMIDGNLDGALTPMETLNGSIEMLDGTLDGTLTPMGTLNGNLTVPKGTTPKQRIDYSNDEDIFNRPQIEGTELIGDKTFAELGLLDITEQDIDRIIFGG